MRILIQNYEEKDMKKLNDLEYEKNYSESMFYTDDGVYRYYLNKLYRQEIQNNHYEVIPYRHYEFLIDHTTFQDGDILYHIPYKHRYCQEHYSVKELGQGLQFVRKQVYDQVSYYFEWSGKLESFVFPKMFTFLM